MTGDELLREAAALGPEKGMDLLGRRINSEGNPTPTELIQAVMAYQDPDTKEMRADAPEDVVALCEEARRALLG